MFGYSVSFSKGTILFYKPGLLIGGTTDHDCNPQRSIIFQLFWIKTATY